MILEGEPVTIYGDGSQTRGFTYVDDIVDETIRAVETEAVESEVLNPGGGARISVNEVVRKRIDTLGADDVKVVYEPHKPGEVRDTQADMSKAKKILGYNPKIRMREGL